MKKGIRPGTRVMVWRGEAQEMGTVLPNRCMPEWSWVEMDNEKDPVPFRNQFLKVIPNREAVGQ